MTSLDTSQFDDDAAAIVSAALAAGTRHRAADRRQLRKLIDDAAGHERKLHRAMVLFAVTTMCANFARRLAEHEGVSPDDVLSRYRENMLIARLDNEIEWRSEDG